MAKVLKVEVAHAKFTVQLDGVEVRALIKILGRTSFSDREGKYKNTKEESTAMSSLYDTLHSEARRNNVFSWEGE